MNRKACIFVLSGLTFFTLFCGTASAIDMEYYTYNGFDPIVSAFQRIALIFGDSAYQSVFFVVMVCSAMFGALMMVMKFVSSGRVSIASWGMPMLIGVVIFSALVVPKGRLFIYDPVKNRFMVVAGVPDGVVLVAGMLNTVERAFIDMIYTAGTPDEYQTQAGGVGFDMLFNLGNKPVQMADKNTQASLKKYIDDCVFFEVQRSGSSISVNDLANNTDFMTIFQNAQNPAIFTTYYDNSGEHSDSCTGAWTRLQTSLSAAGAFSGAIRARCAEAGFDPTVPAELTQCQDTLEGTVTWLEGTGYLAEDIHRQVLMAQALNDTLLAASPDTALTTLASRNIGTSLLASGMIANQWLPVIRGVITAVAIGLIPFMVIFIPTPLAGKAISMCCGLFIWLTAWGVTDAIIHSMAMEMGRKALYEVTQNQLGLSAIMNFSSGGLKALAAFGAVRMAGVMLATAITGMLVKFGGSAMAHLSGQLTATTNSQGQQAAMTTMTPEGMSKELNALESSVPTMANANKYSFSDRTIGATAQKLGNTEAQRETVDSFGFGDAANLYKNTNMGRNIGFGSKGKAMEQFGYSNALNTENFMASSGLHQDKNMQKMYGNDPVALANRKTASEAAFVEQAEMRGMTPAQMQQAISTMDIASTADFIDKYSKGQAVDFQEGSARLGEVLASQKFVGAKSFENARGVASEQGLIDTKTNEHLNEAAKFEMAYQIAHNLGVADNRQDYLGMYAEHGMHHGEETLTLTNQGAVDKLNNRIKAMGYTTKFQKGDRINFAFDQQGNIQSAYGTRGSGRDFKDFTTKTTGNRSQQFNLAEVMTGFRGEYGSSVTSLSRNSTDTYSYADRDGMRYQGQHVRYGSGTGVFTGTIIDADGKKHAGSATLFEGKPVHTMFQNGKTGDIVEKIVVNTGKKDENGQPINSTQWSQSKIRIAPDGNIVVHDKRSVSEEEVRKNGFVASIKRNPETMQPIHESDMKGQHARSENKFEIDNKSNFHGNFQGTIAGHDDMTAMSNAQIGGIMATDMVVDGFSMYRSAGGAAGAHGQFSTKLGSGPGGSNIKIMKRPNGSGAGISHPAAGTPGIVLKPTQVNQPYLIE